MKTYLIIDYSNLHQQYHLVTVTENEIMEHDQDASLTFPLSQKDLAMKVRDNLNRAAQFNAYPEPGWQKKSA